MALIGNGVRMLTAPTRYLGGANQLAMAQANRCRPGGSRSIYAGDATSGNGADKSAIPSGYTPPFCWVLAQKSGGLAARGRVAGSGTVSFANLAGGLNGEASLAGSGTISNALLTLLISANAALSGSGSLAADVNAVGNASSNVSGSGTISNAAIVAAIGASASLSGSGTISNAAMAGILAAAATLSGSGTISSADMSGLVQAVAALSGAGSLAGGISALGNISFSGVGTGSLAAAIIAKANMSAAPTGSGTMTGAIRADAAMSANIAASGELLTASGIASAVWGLTAEGLLSFADIQRILLAVAAGKTTIIDLGGGAATVTFRDQADTKDRVEATMAGSERTSVTVDGS